MSAQLVIRLPSTEISHSTVVDWALFSTDMALLARDQLAIDALVDVAREYSYDFSVLILVPGDTVLLTRVSIPSQQIRKIKQALPFMVEESIACDIENVHLAIPSKLDLASGNIDVAVIDHQHLIGWLDVLCAHELEPDSMIAETLCLPREPGGWCVMADGDDVLIRTGDHSAVKTYKTDAGFVLSLLIDQSQTECVADKTASPTISVVCCMGDSAEDLYNDNAIVTNDIVEQLRKGCVNDIKKLEYREDVFEVLAATAVRTHQDHINLRQGGYKVMAHSHFDVSQWRAAATIAAVGLVIYIAIAVGGGAYYFQQASTADRNSVSLYRQMFPKERRVVSPKKQMQNHLRMSDRSNQGHFLELLSNTAAHFSEADKKMAVNQLRYTAENDSLQLEIRGQNLEQLDELKLALGDSGLAVDISSAAERDDHVIGRFVIRNL